MRLSTPLTLLCLGLSLQAAYPLPQAFQHGVVAADHPLAAEAGLAILKQGGNAFDAAIATSLVLAVVRNQSTGIGGGGFMLYHTAAGKNGVLDYREVAPQQASQDMYLDAKKQVIPQLSTVGYKAVAVPGLLAGLDQIQKQYATQPLVDLMQAAIQHAENGFVVDAHLAHAQQTLAERGAYPDLAALFFKQGQPQPVGAIHKNPELAQSLKTIAQGGVKEFYQGKIAQQIVKAMQQNGGLISASDLANYRPKVRPVLTGTYRGYQILTMPPPSSGGIALLTVLNLMEPYALGWNSTGFGSSQYTHLLSEAMKHAFADRAQFLGDTDFVNVPLQELTSKAYAQQLQPRLQQAQVQTLSREAYGLKGLSWSSKQGADTDHGTTHYAIMDRFGNVVSATETINTYFGSQVVIPGTGIVMNNEMDDFSKAPGVPNAFGLIGNAANAIAPGKKPLSSMTPTIVLKNNQPVLALGASGGPRIITGTLQSLINVLDFGMNLNQAVSAPRVHHQWVPETLFIEQDMPIDVQQALQQKGHHLQSGDAENVVQAVMFKAGLYTGAADPRKGGAALGY